jgi:hypothetical protein
MHERKEYRERTFDRMMKHLNTMYDRSSLSL